MSSSLEAEPLATSPPSLSSLLAPLAAPVSSSASSASLRDASERVVDDDVAEDTLRRRRHALPPLLLVANIPRRFLEYIYAVGSQCLGSQDHRAAASDTTSSRGALGVQSVTAHPGPGS